MCFGFPGCRGEQGWLSCAAMSGRRMKQNGQSRCANGRFTLHIFDTRHYHHGRTAALRAMGGHLLRLNPELHIHLLMTKTTSSNQLWFLDSFVTIRVSASEGEDGISVLDHRMPYG